MNHIDPRRRGRKMKKVIHIVLCIVIYLVLFFICGIVLAAMNLVNEWYSPLVLLFFPLIVVLISSNIYKNHNNKTASKNMPKEKNAMGTIEIQPLFQKETVDSKKKLPSTKKCQLIVEDCVNKAIQAINDAHGASSIDSFFSHSTAARQFLDKAMYYEEKAVCQGRFLPTNIRFDFENSFQWKLRDAIERETIRIQEEILGPQHNNKIACCNAFLQEINVYRNGMTEETYKFALNAYEEVCSCAGINRYACVQNDQISALKLEEVDTMNGHEFEQFCIALLLDNGFQKVSGTKTSGDQGIDILAEKDGIKYGIQCKCYSTDLGNTPIQEAFAGKSIYKCHVAAVMTNRYFTTGGREAAQGTGVLLWDRNKLQEMIMTAQAKHNM